MQPPFLAMKIFLLLKCHRTKMSWLLLCGASHQLHCSAETAHTMKSSEQTSRDATPA